MQQDFVKENTTFPKCQGMQLQKARIRESNELDHSRCTRFLLLANDDVLHNILFTSLLSSDFLVTHT